jgi:hypothetical protein
MPRGLFAIFSMVAATTTMLPSAAYEIPNSSMTDQETIKMIEKLSIKERAHMFDRNIGNTCNELHNRNILITRSDAIRMFSAMVDSSVSDGFSKDNAYKLADVVMTSIYLKCPEIFDVK